MIFRDYHTDFNNACRIIEKRFSDGYKFVGNEIHITEELSAEIKRIKNQAVSLKELIKRYPYRKRQSIINAIQKKDLVLSDIILQLNPGIYISVDDVEECLLIGNVISQKNTLISTKEIISKYKIPLPNINNCISNGRLIEQGGYVNRGEFEEMYYSDKELYSFNSIFKEVIKNNELSLTKTEKKAIKEGVYKQIKDREDVLDPSKILRKNTDKSEFYCIDKREIYSLITNEIKKWFYKFSYENYKYLWNRLPEETKKALIRVYGCKEGEKNEALQKKLHHVMSVLMMKGKKISDWNDADYQGITKSSLPKVVQKDVIGFLKQAIAQKVKTNISSSGIINTKKEVVVGKDRFTIDQYLTLGAVLFQEKKYGEDELIKRALENSTVAMALLYMALHIISGWRKEDYLDIRFLYSIKDINGRINSIRNGDYKLSDFQDVYLSFWKSYKIIAIAKKNKEELVMPCPVDFMGRMGMFLLIAEYHRINENRDRLLEKRFDNIKIYKNALGEETYSYIFGERKFYNKLMNKAFLQCYAEMTAKKYKNVQLKSLPEMVSAYLRSHKFDLDKGQRTIFHYIKFSSEGMNMDEVSIELFKIGTLGFYKDFILELIMPYISKESFYECDLREKAAFAEKIDLSPLECERKIDKYQVAVERLEDLEDLPESERELANKIEKAIKGKTSMGKEENVFCLYQAIHGVNNPNCCCDRYCSGGCGSDNYGGLCKYAIYSYEYIFNLCERKYRLQQEGKELQRLIKEEGTSIRLENTLKKNIMAYEQLNKTINQFLNDKSFPPLLRKDLLEIGRIE